MPGLATYNAEPQVPGQGSMEYSGISEDRKYATSLLAKAGGPPNRLDNVDEIIQDGIYNSGYDKDRYFKCNLFFSDVVKGLTGADVPKIKDERHPENPTSSGGNKKDWPDNPMSAAAMENYYLERSNIPNSGVVSVTPEDGRKLANSGRVVLAVGKGHTTIMAPSKNPWPLVFRSDIQDRGEDKRTRVGLKDGGEGMGFYLINGDEYRMFDESLSKRGFSRKDVHSPYITNDKGKVLGANENYNKLRTQ